MKIKIIALLIMFTLVISCVSCTGKSELPQGEKITTGEPAEVIMAEDHGDTTNEIETEELDQMVEETEEIHGVADTQPQFDEIMSIYLSANYMLEKLVDEYELCDVAVVAKYAGDLKTYAAEVSGFPITLSQFEVNEVLKGSYDEKTAVIQYSGGVVSVYDAMQKISEDTIKKRGWDVYTEEEAKKVGITLDFGETSEGFSDEKEYLLLLYYDENGGVRTNRFRLEVIEGDRVYDKMEDEYIKLSELG